MQFGTIYKISFAQYIVLSKALNIQVIPSFVRRVLMCIFIATSTEKIFCNSIQAIAKATPMVRTHFGLLLKANPLD